MKRIRRPRGLVVKVSKLPNPERKANANRNKQTEGRVIAKWRTEPTPALRVQPRRVVKKEMAGTGRWKCQWDDWASEEDQLESEDETRPIKRARVARMRMGQGPPRENVSAQVAEDVQTEVIVRATVPPEERSVEQHIIPPPDTYPQYTIDLPPRLPPHLLPHQRGRQAGRPWWGRPSPTW